MWSNTLQSRRFLDSSVTEAGGGSPAFFCAYVALLYAFRIFVIHFFIVWLPQLDFALNPLKLAQ
jgi:hypothetical protein